MYILAGFGYCLGRLFASCILNNFNNDLIVCSHIIAYSFLLELFTKDEE